MSALWSIKCHCGPCGSSSAAPAGRAKAARTAAATVNLIASPPSVWSSLSSVCRVGHARRIHKKTIYTLVPGTPARALTCPLPKTSPSLIAQQLPQLDDISREPPWPLDDRSRLETIIPRGFFGCGRSRWSWAGYRVSPHRVSIEFWNPRWVRVSLSSEFVVQNPSGSESARLSRPSAHIAAKAAIAAVVFT